MANNRIILKRTNTAGRTPNTTGSYVTNSQFISAGELALNMADGILYSSNGSAVIEVGANNTNVRITGNLTINAIIANGSSGTSGQFLTSNGSATYWSGGGFGTVTSVATGNGMTGGPVTTTGTVSVLANTGIVANATGVFVNATYIGTLSANDASFLGGIAAASYVNSAQLSANLSNYQTTAGLAANVATLAANSATFANSSVTNTFTVGTASYFVANGNLGIGTDSPVRPLHIAYTSGIAAANLITSDAFIITAENTAPGFSIISSANSSAASRAVFKGVRSRGTLSSPTAANTNDSVISMLGAVFDGNTGLATAAIDMVVDGSVSVGVAPQRIAFLTGNTNSRTERMRIDSSGNVGIGTTSPSERLHVNSGAAEFAVQWDSTGSNSWVLGSATNRAYIRNKTSGAEVLTIFNGGNVGIGTTTAAQALQVNSSIRATLGGTNSIAELRGGNADGAVLQLFRAGNTSQFAGFSQFQGSLFIKNVDTGPVIFNTTTSDTERMRITSAGDVGIGNTAPNAKLQVTGNANVSGNVVIGGTLISGATVTGAGFISTPVGGEGGQITFRNPDNASDGLIVDIVTSNTGRIFQTAANSVLQIGQLANTGGIVDVYTGGSVRLRADAGGNVGISNTSPDARLTVTGTANVSGNVAIGGVTTFNANIILGSSGVSANGGFGTAGHVLHSNGSATYWAADDNSGGTVTSVDTGNGMTGGSITTTGTVSVLANTGIVANSTGTFVNATYIGTISSNNASFLGGIAAASYVNSAQLSANLSNYQTTAGLSANVATLTANNTSFVGSVTAANVVSNAQLSGNLANYAALSGATFTGAVVVSNNLTVTGNLTLSGNTLIVGANNLVISDAIISLHTPANLASLTSNDGKNIGLAFHYYDTEDKHALLYRDNSTGRLQYHNDGGDPLTNSNPTGNNLGVIQANSFWSGNDSVFATTNSTVYTGTANNASFLGGVASANYVRKDQNNDIVENIRIRFGSTNQTDVNDGTIAAGLFANGLNIVGTQTQAGTGRQISYYGTLIDRANAGASFAGNVGIGTSTPAARLAVEGNNIFLSANDASPRIEILNRGNNTTNRFPALTVTHYTGNSTGGDSGGLPVVELSRFRGSVGAFLPIQSGDILGGYNTWGSNSTSSLSATRIQGVAEAAFTTTATAGLQFITTSAGTQSEKVRIAANGNVGIGNTAPNNRLTVQKAAGESVEGEIYLTDSTYWTRFNTRSSAGAFTPLVQAGDHTVIYSDGTSNTGALVIGQWSSESRGIRIDAGGNVGISNSSPNAKLQVTGTANISGNVAIGGITTFSANVVLGSSGVSANGGFGTAGQVLTTNGTATYWATAAGGGSINTASQYTWTNTQTFSANVTFNAAIVAGGTAGGSGQVLTSNGSAVYWSTVSAPSSVFPLANVITNTAFTAVKDNRYFLTNASPTTVSLPVSPSVGDTVYIVVVNNLANNTVARNGSNIMSLAENLILDINYFSIGLTYVTANTGWVIV